MHIEVERISSVTLEGEEVNQLWRLLKNECENAEMADQTTYEMYSRLRRFFKEEGE